MKIFKLSIFVLALSLIAGCNSPSSSSGGMEIIELNVGGAPYNGTFTNNRGDDSGSIRFSLVQSTVSDASTGTVPITGLITIDTSVCLLSGEATGELNGSTLTLRLGQGGNGELIFVLRATNNKLEGEYTVSGESCSNATGTGTVSANR